MAKNELNVEDLVFSEDQREQDYLELPLSRQTFLLVAAAVLLVGGIALFRTGSLNFLSHGFYAGRAEANANKEVALPAPRGIISDRFGRPLVENRSSFTVFLNAAELLKDSVRLEEAALAVGEILDQNPEEIKKVVSAVNLEKKSFVAVGRDITSVQAIKIRDLNLHYVQISDDYRRYYPDAPVFSHILGYVGASEQSSEVAGKSGIEAQYEDWLKGKDGTLIIHRDAAGKALESKVAAPSTSGQDFALTIDGGLQEYFYKRLRDGLASLGRETGVGLAIDPNNGELLALVSLPSFDNNNLKKYLSAPGQPLFNRAISGVYTPGSAIKPLVGLAALRENLIDPEYQILSTGSIEIPNPYDPSKPSRFLDWKPHGWVDLHSALARSSNVYFYQVGGGFAGFKGLGIERLRQYWQKFLLGVKTGIDLPAESEGFLPSAEEKEKRTGQIWRIGDTYNVSIGQGDLLLTPLQLINFIASVANGGRIYKPALALGHEPEVLLDYSEWNSELEEIQIGMEDAVRKPYGTANMLASLPVKSAGKTGSSQVANNTRTNAFFVGYAPAESPKIAVLVLIENAREGSLNAVPIARDVLEWYHYNRLIQNGQAPTKN